MQHFEGAMAVVAAMDNDDENNVSTDVMEWLFDEYTPMGYASSEDFVGTRVLRTAACAGHAMLLTRP